MAQEREIRIIVDTREKLPLSFYPTIETTRWKYRISTISRALREGDYQIDGHPGGFVVERKNGVDELLQCCTRHRERFLSVVERMLTYKTKLIVVEGHFSDIGNRNYGTNVTPYIAYALVDSLQEIGLPIRWCPTREVASAYIANAARRYLERLDREADAARATAPAPR